MLESARISYACTVPVLVVIIIISDNSGSKKNTEWFLTTANYSTTPATMMITASKMMRWGNGDYYDLILNMHFIWLQMIKMN